MMPTIPGYRDLAPAPRAGQQVIGIEASPVGGAIANAGEVMMQMAEEKKRRDDVTATTEALNQADAETRKLFIEDGGYLTREGKNAEGIVPKAAQSREQLKQALYKNLPSSQAQEAFVAKFDSETSSLLDATARRANEQGKKTMNQALEARVEISNNKAVTENHDSEMVMTAINDANEAIDAFGIANGLPDEKIQQMKAENISKIYASTAEYKFKSKSPDAGEYLNNNKNMLSSESLHKLSLMDIDAKREQDVYEMLDVVRQLPFSEQAKSNTRFADPETQKMWNSVFGAHFSGLKRARDAESNRLKDNGIKAILANEVQDNKDRETLTELDPSAQIGLDGIRASMAGQARKIEKDRIADEVNRYKLTGVPVSTEVWNHMLAVAPDQAVKYTDYKRKDQASAIFEIAQYYPDDFRSLNLADYDLDPRDRGNLRKLQTDKNAIRSWETANQAFNRVASEVFGLNPSLIDDFSEKNKDAANEIRALRDRFFDEAIDGTPSPKEVREMAERLKIDIILIKKDKNWLGWNTEEEVIKKAAFTEIKGVPTEVIDDYAEQLKYQGDEVTEENIKQLYDKDHKEGN